MRDFAPVMDHDATVSHGEHTRPVHPPQFTRIPAQPLPDRHVVTEQSADTAAPAAAARSVNGRQLPLTSTSHGLNRAL